MENISINWEINLEVLIAALSFAATIVAGIYAIATSTRKYEFTESYRKELLEWYASVIHIMMKIIHDFESEKFLNREYADQKSELLSELSALIEVGRFYFPNWGLDRGFGSKKPSAYRGYRHNNLTILILFYRMVSENKPVDISILWEAERAFTSVIFDMVDPRKRNEEYTKYLSIKIPEGEFPKYSKELKDLMNKLSVDTDGKKRSPKNKMGAV